MKATASISSSSSSRRHSSAEFLKEQIKYQNLPSTVFAPSGRLHQVERIYSQSMDLGDEQSSLCVAILCNNATSVVLVTTSPISPYCDLEYLVMPSSTSMSSLSPSMTSDQQVNETTKSSSLEHYHNYTAPLLLSITDATTTSDRSRTCSFSSLTKLNSLPFCVVGSSSLLVANGGNAIQSHVLETKIQEIVLGLFQEEQCNLQRAIPTSLVARYLSDVNQIPTQSLVDEDHTQMLSCSTLLVGLDDDNADNQQVLQPPNGGNQRRRRPCIWKVDSTGRYTKCDMAAVGRGANVVETCLIKHVLYYKLGIKEEIDNDDEDDAPPHENDLSLMEIIQDGYITNDDVQQYCNSLSTEDALMVAQKCILETLQKHSAATSTKIISTEEEDNTTERSKSTTTTRMFQPRAWGLLHGVVMEPNKNRPTTSNILSSAKKTKQQQRYKRNESPFMLRYLSEGDITKLASKTSTTSNKI